MSDFLDLTGLSYFFNKIDNFFIRKSILNTSGTTDYLRQFPVGSIYLSINSTNPSSTFGGTWVAWGTGRVPVGVDTTDADFSSVEATGGEKSHILTVDEIPSHTHSYTTTNLDNTGRHGGNTSRTIANYVEDRDTSSTGSDGAHNNMMPYITCYMWKRTA